MTVNRPAAADTDETPGCGTCLASVNRRRVLAVSAAAVAGLALTACGDSGDGGSGAGSGGSDGNGGAGGGANGGAGGGATGGSAQPGPGTPGGGGGKVLAATADIPVGGGKIFADQKVVVTQPTAGTFKGFRAVCTHQGSALTKVSDGAILCPLHGSRFGIGDGVPRREDPAKAPLETVAVRVEGGNVVLG